jgi:hypothetical protein
MARGYSPLGSISASTFVPSFDFAPISLYQIRDPGMRHNPTLLKTSPRGDSLALRSALHLQTRDEKDLTVCTHNPWRKIA